MENRRALMWALGGAATAMFAFFLAYQKAVDNETRDFREKMSVVVARVDIQPNQRIDRGMLSIRADWPKSLMSPEWLPAESFEQVENQVSLTTLRAGEPIFLTKLIPFDESVLDRRVKDGMRAVTIGIRDDQDVVGVGGHIRPGMNVDVLLTLFISTKDIEKGGVGAAAALLGQDGSLKAETRTIFQNVPVLAVGRDSRLRTASVARGGVGGEFAEVSDKNVTVALSPKDVQSLVLAQAIGRITLSLRNFNDSEVQTLDYLDPFRAFGIKLPIVSGPAPAYREIRGGQVLAAPF